MFKLRSREADVGDIDRHEDGKWNCGAVRFPAKSPPLGGDLDSGKILVLGQVMRGRCAAGNRRAVIHSANQAFAIDVENLLRAVRRDVVRKHDPEPPAFFAVVMPRLDFFRLEPGQGKDERRIEVIPHRVTAEIGEIQIVPRSFDGMAVKGSAGIFSVLDWLSVLSFVEGPVRSAYAAHAFADEVPVADPLAFVFCTD